MKTAGISLMILSLCAISFGSVTTTLLFENTGIEEGLTVEGATKFMVDCSKWYGGRVRGIPGESNLLASGEHAYIIESTCGGAVKFYQPVDSVNFYYAYGGKCVPSGTCRVYDAWSGGNLIGEYSAVKTNKFNDDKAWINIELPGQIRRIEWDEGSIDNFSYTTTVPAPGSILLTLLGCSLINRIRNRG